MKRILFVITGIAMSVSLVCAQTAATSPPVKVLSVGDDASALLFPNILNYPQKAMSMAQLKGKLVILDFWATWCPPCVAGMPKFEAIQKRWPDQVLVLPVTMEKEETVKHFYSLRGALTLPSVVGDSTLQFIFPHILIPHEVIIDASGKVAAITSSDNITEEAIEKLLSNAAVDIPLKKDVMAFDRYKPLLVDSNDAMEHTILFRSMVLPSLMGIGSGSCYHTTIGDQVVGFNHVNTLIPHLFLYALNRPAEWMDSRVVMENVKDPTRYISDNEMDYSSVATEWSRKNIFCYDIIAPGVPDSARRAIMLEALNTYFGASRGLHVSLAFRTMPCYLLKRIPGKNIPASIASMQSSFSKEDESLTLQKFPMPDLAASLETLMRKPVVNATHYTGATDLKLTNEVQSEIAKDDFASLEQLLRQKGLQLVKSRQRVEVLLFTEK